MTLGRRKLTVVDTASGLRRLAREGKSACYVSTQMLCAYADLSWLKPYVLLYDTIALSSREGGSVLEPTLDTAPELKKWLQHHALIVRDFVDELPGMEPFRPERVDEYTSIVGYLPADVKKKIFTKKGSYDYRFLKSYVLRNRHRDGLSAVGHALVRFGDEAFRENNVAVNAVIRQELGAAWSTVGLTMATGIPRVLDATGAWFAQKFCIGPYVAESAVPRFERIATTDVPDFTKLPWKDVLQLRESRYRRQALQRLRSLPSSTNAAARIELTQELWRLAAEVGDHTRVRQTILEGVGGLLPVAPLNPIGLLSSANAVARAAKLARRFGWLFYLAAIRKRLTQGEMT